MNPRDVARVDQLVAVLREADRPLTVQNLCEQAGDARRNGWSVAATAQLLVRLRAHGIIRMDGVSCCLLHARWVPPPDE